MAAHDFDDPALRAALRDYLAAADRLAASSPTADDPKDLLDLAEAKSLAGMRVRRRLVDLGWSAPAAVRAET